MKILNLHGLNGSCHNTNYEFLSEYYKDTDIQIISPQIDYISDSPYHILLEVLKICRNPSIIVGNSFGGFFAYVIGATLPIVDLKTILINPCIPPHQYIGNLVSDYKYLSDLEEMWNTIKGMNRNYKMLLGDSDKVLDINTTLNILNPSNENYSIISGGHSLKGEEYESWFKEQLK